MSRLWQNQWLLNILICSTISQLFFISAKTQNYIFNKNVYTIIRLVKWRPSGTRRSCLKARSHRLEPWYRRPSRFPAGMTASREETAIRRAPSPKIHNCNFLVLIIIVPKKTLSWNLKCEKYFLRAYMSIYIWAIWQNIIFFFVVYPPN